METDELAFKDFEKAFDRVLQQLKFCGVKPQRFVAVSAATKRHFNFFRIRNNCYRSGSFVRPLKNRF